MKRIVKKLLITGCGRSGSKYIAACLRKAKVRVRHEQMGDDGTVSCPFVTYRSSVETVRFNDFQQFGHKGRERPSEFELVWHQTRHPLKVIGSLRDVMLMPVKEWSKVVFNQPIGLGKRYDLRWAMEHYVNACTMADTICKFRYKIEDISTVWPDLLKRLNCPEVPLPDVSTTMNRSQRTIKVFKPVKELYNSIRYPTIEDLYKMDKSLTKSVLKLSKKYGYQLEE